MKVGVSIQLEEKSAARQRSKDEDRAALEAAKAAARAAEEEEAAAKRERERNAASYAKDLDVLVAQKTALKGLPDVSPLEAALTARWVSDTKASISKGKVPIL